MSMPIKPATFPLYGMEPGAIAKKAATSGAGGVGGTGAVPGTGAISGEGTKVDFSEKLREALNEANQTQVKAEKAAEDYSSGKQNDLHGTMITMTEADIKLRLVSNVRNKAIEAYREIMRMGS